MFEIDLSPLAPGVHQLTRELAPGALRPDPPEDAASQNGRDASSNGGGGSESETPGSAEAPDPVTEDVDFGPVHVEAVVDYQPDRVLVSFEARSTAELTCDRTLRRFDQPLHGHYAVLFAEPGRNTPERSDDHDELRELGPGQRYLDLTDVVRDTLLLAIPQRKVAPGAEDEELDTVHGASGEDAIDPRWEKLRQLKDDPPAGD